MFRDTLIFSNSFRPEALLDLAEQLDWELEHIYPPRSSSHGGRIWTAPDATRVHYIEDARFYVRYLLLNDGVSPQKLFASLSQVLPTLSESDLFHTISTSDDPVARIEALHKSSALVSPSDSDPAYLELLRRLLDIQESLSIRLATLQLCEHLAWPELTAHIRPLTQEEWPGSALARHVLESLD